MQKSYKLIYQHAVDRYGSKAIVESLLPQPKSTGKLCEQSDNYYLSTLCRRVFQAGLRHSVVDNKWPAFERAFYQFEPLRVAMMTDEDLEALMGNSDIIRHWNKIKSVRINANLICRLIEEYRSVGNFLASWTDNDVIGLWSFLKKQGAQLGGNSGPMFLRMVSKDTFILTEDVVVALKAQKIVDRHPNSQRDLIKVQDAFIRWKDESSRPFCQISRLLSMTVNY